MCQECLLSSLDIPLHSMGARRIHSYSNFQNVYTFYFQMYSWIMRYLCVLVAISLVLTRVKPQSPG